MNDKFKYWTTKDICINSKDAVREVADFLQRNFCPKGVEPMWSLKSFLWKFDNEVVSGGGYLSCAMCDGKIVGVASLTKKRALINGKECIVGELGDTYTLPSIMRKSRPLSLSETDSNPNSYINKSIFGRLINDIVNKALDDNISIIYGTPNNNSYPGYTKKLGFVDTANYNNISYIRPTARMLANRYKILKPFDIILKYIEMVLIMSQSSIYNNILFVKSEFSPCNINESEINKLWDDIKPQSGFSLIRDYSYWMHRYVKHPDMEYKFFEVRIRKQLAAIVVTRYFKVSNNKNAVAIVEWMMEDSKYFKLMLSNIVNYYKRSQIDYFYLWAEELGEYAKAAKNVLFVFKKKAPIIIANTETAASDLIINSQSLSFFLGSSDAV